jgi:uncharacterized lipoprotein NlpE involved in copper resistance
MKKKILMLIMLVFLLCGCNAKVDIKIDKYTIDETKCQHCKHCIAKFYNGCITCQVLAGKKTDLPEDIDS